ncbi:MAG: hydrogenase maturation nickel metallochaperone HypA [Candidatus Omnitrophica bacterium]|nr:hydrogenase maturation nickel metallochaperone HypA [Candidatus Omnitrophota bacterium]
MHETHLIEPIIKGISEHAQKEGAGSVSKIRLKVGEFMGVKEDSFKETFSVLAKGTMLKDAELELTFFPGSRIEVLSFDIE